MKTVKGKEASTLKILRERADADGIIRKAAQYWKEMGHETKNTCFATLSNLVKTRVLERVGKGTYRLLKEGEIPIASKFAPVSPPLPPKDNRVFLSPKEKYAFDRLNVVNKQISSGECRVAGEDFLNDLDEEKEKLFLAKMRASQILGGAIGNGEKGKIFPFNPEAYLQALEKVVVTAAASFPELIRAAEAELQTLAQIMRGTKKEKERNQKQLAKAEATFESSKLELSQLEQKEGELRKTVATLAVEVEKIRREIEQQDPRWTNPQKAAAQVKRRLSMLRKLLHLPEEERVRLLHDLQV